MKTINQVFTDAEYQRLLEKKGNQIWHDFILLNCADRPLSDDDCTKEGAVDTNATLSIDTPKVSMQPDSKAPSNNNQEVKE